MPRVPGLRAAIVERREERARRDVFLARIGADLKEKALRAGAREELERALAVGVPGDTMVRSGTIVLGVEESLGAVDVEHRSGREDVDAPLGDVSDGCLAALAPEAPGFDEALDSRSLSTGRRHDVDHGEERVSAVQSRPRTAKHFD